MHFPRLKLFHKPTCWRLWEVFLQRSWQVCLKEGQGNTCWLIRLCTSHSAHSFCLSALGWQLVIWDNFSLALKSCSCFFFFFGCRGMKLFISGWLFVSIFNRISAMAVRSWTQKLCHKIIVNTRIINKAKTLFSVVNLCIICQRQTTL